MQRQRARPQLRAAATALAKPQAPRAGLRAASSSAERARGCSVWVINLSATSFLRYELYVMLYPIINLPVATARCQR